METNIYMVVIAPSDKAIEDAIEFKEMAQDRLGRSFPSRKSFPHLTLHLCQDFHNESKLYKFEEIISLIKPFNIYIDGFGMFKSNGTIFLRPVFDENIRSLSEQLGGERITPHITIARNLTPWDRDFLWKFFEERRYFLEFACKSVSVLKRVNGHWKKHIELYLGSSLN